MNEERGADGGTAASSVRRPYPWRPLVVAIVIVAAVLAVLSLAALTDNRPMSWRGTGPAIGGVSSLFAILLRTRRRWATPFIVATVTMVAAWALVMNVVMDRHLSDEYRQATDGHEYAANLPVVPPGLRPPAIDNVRAALSDTQDLTKLLGPAGQAEQIRYCDLLVLDELNAIGFDNRVHGLDQANTVVAGHIAWCLYGIQQHGITVPPNLVARYAYQPTA